MEMLLVDSYDGLKGLDLERLAYVLRRRAQHEQHVYFASLSCRTVVYKGLLTTAQLEAVYPELHDPDLTSALTLVFVEKREWTSARLLVSSTTRISPARSRSSTRASRRTRSRHGSSPTLTA